MRDLGGVMNKLRLLFFLLVPVSLACALSPTPSSGVQGTMMISPVSGGPLRKGQPESKPLPDMEFLVKQGERVVTSFRTDGQGHFEVKLAPGHYMITRKDSQAGVGFYGPFEVDVSAAQMKTVQWECDSGIR
jgi:hypothetical protein